MFKPVHKSCFRIFTGNPDTNVYLAHFITLSNHYSIIIQSLSVVTKYYVFEMFESMASRRSFCNKFEANPTSKKGVTAFSICWRVWICILGTNRSEPDRHTLFSEVEFLGLRPIKLIPAPWGDRYVVVDRIRENSRELGSPWDGF